ncbi:hypothetical protein HRbin36_02717 [bacterium HR36]|nr:hypothetical protein HRbin36_02717 [bacterium HR36]
MAQEQFHRFRLNTLDFLVVLLAVPAQEKLGESGNVLFPFPKRWEINGNHVKAVIQVITESAGFHFPFQLDISSSDDSSIHANSATVAHSLEFLFLQDPQ